MHLRLSIIAYRIPGFIVRLIVGKAAAAPDNLRLEHLPVQLQNPSQLVAFLRLIWYANELSDMVCPAPYNAPSTAPDAADLIIFLAIFERPVCFTSA